MPSRLGAGIADEARRRGITSLNQAGTYPRASNMQYLPVANGD
jgi:hypothetical protein